MFGLFARHQITETQALHLVRQVYEPAEPAVGKSDLLNNKLPISDYGEMTIKHGCVKVWPSTHAIIVLKSRCERVLFALTSVLSVKP